jgi:23S rRNA (adenine2503-C2)-methyltransferase
LGADIFELSTREAVVSDPVCAALVLAVRQAETEVRCHPNHRPQTVSVFRRFVPVLDPRDLAPAVFAAEARALGTAEPSIRRLVAAVVGRGIHDPLIWGRDFQVPRKLREAITSPLPRLQLERSVTSSIDGFEKLLFRTHDGLPLESVLIPLHKPGAVSLCLSSQVGCPMGCVFCATARMPRRRSLETWEIIDQFIQAREIVNSEGRRVTGAVFMGMGEPFLNYDRVLAAADLLRCPFGGSVAARSITISTVGLVPEIDRFTREDRRFRLAISLGAATDAKRAQLVPLAGRTPVSLVMAAARRHALARRDRVMLVYVCIGGVNVEDADAEALADLIGDTPVRLDLIDVADAAGRFLAPAPQEYRRFRDALARWLPQPVVRRYSGGADIQAACGTLAGSEPLRAIEWPTLAASREFQGSSS